MAKKPHKLLAWHFEDRYYYLFVVLALFILLPPFLIQYAFLSYLIYVLLTLVIINCVLILFDHSKRSGYGLLLLVVVLVFIWVSVTQQWQAPRLQLLKLMLIAGFFIATYGKMVREIFKMEKVSAKVVVGGIGAYLLLGLIGAFLFEMVEVMVPGSFTKMAVFTGFYAQVYYSFVTISTLGYGDITPLTPQGQAIAILVSLSGQIYLAVLMAMLVGKFLKDSDS